MGATRGGLPRSSLVPTTQGPLSMAHPPPFCPYHDCPSHAGSPFRYRRRGFFRRFCDQRTVQRFQCLACKRGFSEQTLRLDWRLKRPDLLVPIFKDRVSKVTHRQSARNLACSRSTEERHFRRLAAHCKAFHETHLKKAPAGGGRGERFLLDEAETYEHHRKLKPLTVPVLIERHSGFMIYAMAGMLPPRGRRTPAEERQLERQIASEGKRRSESYKLVKAAFELLLEVAPKDRPITVLTDEKPSYATILRRVFGERCSHLRTPSTRKRDLGNPLWPINHTMARLRDNISRLVRETWAASKKRRWLAGQLDIMVCYRNYVRGRTNRQPNLTPAMALGLETSLWSAPQLLESRVFPW